MKFILDFMFIYQKSDISSMVLRKNYQEKPFDL